MERKETLFTVELYLDSFYWKHKTTGDKTRGSANHFSTLSPLGCLFPKIVYHAGSADHFSTLSPLGCLFPKIIYYHSNNDWFEE